MHREGNEICPRFAAIVSKKQPRFRLSLNGPGHRQCARKAEKHNTTDGPLGRELPGRPDATIISTRFGLFASMSAIPPMTTMRVEFYQIGWKAALYLYDKIHMNTETHNIINMTPQLVM